MTFGNDLFGGDNDPFSTTTSETIPSQQDANLAQKQNDLLKRQEAEKTQRSKQLEQQRIALLRGRFGSAGGGATDGSSPDSLYSRITGR